MSGENIKLTCPLCHELWKMVLSVLFSYTLPYMEKALSTTECSSGYRPHTELGVVSAFCSCHQLCVCVLYVCMCVRVCVLYVCMFCNCVCVCAFCVYVCARLFVYICMFCICVCSSVCVCLRLCVCVTHTSSWM